MAGGQGWTRGGRMGGFKDEGDLRWGQERHMVKATNKTRVCIGPGVGFSAT